MIYRIVHKTTYKYKTPVSFGNHVAYLTPRPLPRHTRTSHELLITPAPADQKLERVVEPGQDLRLMMTRQYGRTGRPLGKK